MNKVLEFLEALSVNNNRDWFHDNRDWYEESRDKFLFVTDVMINEIRKFDPEIPVMSPKDCMFRIFRDVRFSNDKRPYKTNFGSYISKGGRKGVNAGYYFHISPEENFIGGGIYMPPAEPLKAVRSYISTNACELLEIISQPAFKNMYHEMYDDKLKTAPKGFPKDHEHIELLRYKSFIFSHLMSRTDVIGENFIEKMVTAFRLLQPFNQYLNKAVDKIR